MRLSAIQIAAFLVLGVAFAPRAAGQNPETMMPEASAAKAKQVLQQLIDALGGPAYLNVKERECDGRRAQFGHNGEMTGYIDFKDYWRYPDKHRTDYSKKGTIIDVFNGNQGWTLDHGGVSEESGVAVAEFQEQAKRNIDNLLRVRLQEPGVNVAYGGSGLVDLHEVDWVEIDDHNERTFRLAVSRSTHLPLQMIIRTEDREMRERTEEKVVFSNLHPQDGVQTPMQISRERDGRRFYQAFFESCKYNSGLPEDFFTKAALEKHFAQTGSRKDKKRREVTRD